MCRILISLGRGRSLYPIYPSFVSSLYRAAKCDPYSIDLFGSGEKSHRDGWGRLNIQLFNRDISINLIKSLKPIYVEKPPIRLALSPLEEYIDDAFFIDFIHARAGSTGMPKNIFSVHPFQEETRNGSMLYLIHNGAARKEDLLKELKIDSNSEYAKLYTDSYFLTKYIASKVEDELNENIIKDISRFIKTALNLGIALVTDSYVDVIVGSYYLEDEKPRERRNYYKIYKVNINGATIYTSSTLIDFPEYRPSIVVKYDELENGQYDLYRISYGAKISFEYTKSFKLT